MLQDQSKVLSSESSEVGNDGLQYKTCKIEDKTSRISNWPGVFSGSYHFVQTKKFADYVPLSSLQQLTLSINNKNLTNYNWVII